MALKPFVQHLRVEVLQGIQGEEGALADLLLVDGDPLADIELIADPDRNMLVIMKDGKIFKYILPGS